MNKKSFKPKTGETYYYYPDFVGYVFDTKWRGELFDYTAWKIGNCFKTKAEAETKGKKLIEKIKKEYEDE